MVNRHNIQLFCKLFFVIFHYIDYFCLIDANAGAIMPLDKVTSQLIRRMRRDDS